MNLAIFASGNGTNAENIIRYFFNNPDIHIRLILTNNPDAFVLKRIKPYEISSFVFSAKTLRTTDLVLNKLIEYNIDYIILAGFLLMIPENILNAYPERIINIHPALLPKYGGKGMYGMYVHRAVIDSKEKESGITIHYIDNEYDKGKIIFQANCYINEDETPETLSDKIHLLEQQYFPSVIENEIRKTSL